MQLLGASSLFLCVTAMLTILAGWQWVAIGTFALALTLMAGSLAFLFKEILMSGGALEILLNAMEGNEE